MAISSDVLKQHFLDDLQKILFDESLEYIKFSKDHTTYLANSIVNVPNAANSGLLKVRVNPTGATTSSTRDDTNLTYAIDFLATDSQHIGVRDEMMTSYAARQNTIEEHGQKLNEYMGYRVAYNWCGNVATASTTLTTGASVSGIAPSGGTGDRLRLTKADIRDIAKSFDQANVPKSGRYMAICSQHYWDLFEDDQISNIDFQGNKPMVSGVFTTLYGIDLIVKNDVLIGTTNNKTLVDPDNWDVTTAAQKSYGSIVWQRDMVSRAMGGYDVFVHLQDPDKYGASTISAGVFLGSSGLRSDGAGITFILSDIG